MKRFVLLIGLTVLALLPDAARAASTERASVSSSEVEANGGSFRPAISSDGRFVAFESAATNLDPGDPDTFSDIFLRDRINGVTTYISRADGPAGTAANFGSLRASVNRSGRFVAYESLSSNLDPDDIDTVNDIYVRDVLNNDTILVSRASGAAGAKGNGVSLLPSISAGREIAFHSLATNLDAADSDATSDVFMRDLDGGGVPTSLMSRATGPTGAKGNGGSSDASISANGVFVAFSSNASNLDPADVDSTPDVFMRGGTDTTYISRASGVAGAGGNNGSGAPAVNQDGRYVAFTSASTNFDPDDADLVNDIYVRDTVAFTTALVSRASGAAGVKGNGDSFASAISADGRYVAFRSIANNLVPGDTNNLEDIFVRDLVAEYTVRVNLANDGSQTSANQVEDPSISAAGLVAFDDSAPLVIEDSNLTFDVYVRSADTDGDLILEPFDNCLDLSNAGQVDTDLDGQGDSCDPDDDNDEAPDSVDACDLRPEDYDGFQDADGCPDPDNDLDGVLDNSDVGRYCFDAAGVLPCHLASPSDCSNVEEDIDAFKDGDGCPEPDNDNDSFPDATDDCPGTDSQAGADGMLGAPQDLNHNGIKDGAEAAFTTDDVLTYAFEDRDGVLDTDGCHDSPGEDFDQDGFTDDNEALKIGTDPGYPCGTGGWPADFVGGEFSTNMVTIQDLGSFLAPVFHFNTFPQDPGFDARWDLIPGPAVPNGEWINIQDMAALLAGPTSTPPMLNGASIFNGPSCPLPP